MSPCITPLEMKSYKIQKMSMKNKINKSLDGCHVGVYMWEILSQRARVVRCREVPRVRSDNWTPRSARRCPISITSGNYFRRVTSLPALWLSFALTTFCFFCSVRAILLPSRSDRSIDSSQNVLLFAAIFFFFFFLNFYGRTAADH